MAKGTVYDCERAIVRDARSGLRILRLTHAPCIASNLYFEMCSFSVDEQYVIFIAQRFGGRDAPWDLFRARTDGLELVQITEENDLQAIVVSPESDRVYYITGGLVRATGIHSLEEEAVVEAPVRRPVYPRSLAAIDGGGTTYFANGFDERGRCLLFKLDLRGGKVDVLLESQQQNHITVDASGSVVAFNNWQAEGIVPSFISADGSGLRPQSFAKFAHNTWFGPAKKVQGTLLPPGHAIVTFEEGDAEPRILTEGRYYWHSSASRDAQWIVSDTNWPQEGLYLFHVPSRTVSYVCDPKSSCSHPQWTHPHPSLSPAMRYVLFNSDLTGIGQVYLAELTDEFLEQATIGHLCKPNTLL